MIIGGILNLLAQHSIDINDHYSLVTFNLLERLRSIRECTGGGGKLQGDECVGGFLTEGEKGRTEGKDVKERWIEWDGMMEGACRC